MEGLEAGVQRHATDHVHDGIDDVTALLRHAPAQLGTELGEGTTRCGHEDGTESTALRGGARIERGFERPLAAWRRLGWPPPHRRQAGDLAR